MARPPSTPWETWKGRGLEPGSKPILTFVEVQAIQRAWRTGRFSKASLARIYDVYSQAIDRVIAGPYRYHREKRHVQAQQAVSAYGNGGIDDREVSDQGDEQAGPQLRGR